VEVAEPLNTLVEEVQEVLEDLFQVLMVTQAQKQLQHKLIQLQLVGVALDNLLLLVQVGQQHQVLILLGVQSLQTVVVAVEVMMVVVE
jgi:hypothetical protein